MTYQKLFRQILTASTLVLLLVWGVSLFYRAGIRRTPFRFAIVHGTLESAFTRQAPETVNEDIIFTETLNGGLEKLPDRGMDHPLGRWKAKREDETILGTSHPDLHVHTLHVPLWLPWLLVVAGAFFFCRLMEKRSVSGMEKKLAEGNAVDRLQGDRS